MERDFESEIRSLEEALYCGRWIHQGDYDYDHAGLWHWEPDWQRFENAKRELLNIQKAPACPDELNSKINRILEKAYTSQTRAAGKVEQRTVVISSHNLTPDCYDETLPH